MAYLSWNVAGFTDSVREVMSTLNEATGGTDPWLAEAIATLQGWFARVRDSKPFPGWADSKPCIVVFYY